MWYIKFFSLELDWTYRYISQHKLRQGGRGLLAKFNEIQPDLLLPKIPKIQLPK